jgi:hypothetical protein
MYGVFVQANGPPLRIASSVVHLDGGTNHPHYAVYADGTGQLDVVNSVVDVLVGNIVSGIAVAGGVGLVSTGNLVRVPGSSRALAFLNSGPAASFVLNSVLVSPQSLMDVSNANSTITIAHSTLLGTTAAGVSLAGGLGTFEQCLWTGCAQAPLNLPGTCALPAPDYALAPAEVCRGAGVDPQTFGVSIPGQDRDRKGEARPGFDGAWDIGPDEVATP